MAEIRTLSLSKISNTISMIPCAAIKALHHYRTAIEHDGCLDVASLVRINFICCDGHQSISIKSAFVGRARQTYDDNFWHSVSILLRGVVA